MAKLKRKAKRKLSILFIVLLVVGGFFLYSFLNKNNTASLKDQIKDKIEEKQKEVYPKTYKASLIATGDGLIHTPLAKAAYNKDTGKYDFTRMLTYTKDIIKDYDIKYYNQETVFDDDKSYTGYPRFNTPSGFGESMINIGFNLVSLSSNHSLDMGATSAKKSATWWENQEGVITNGMASSEEKRNDIEIGNANGITYAMLSYTYGTNGLGASEINAEPYIVNLFNEDQVLKDIELVRDKVDVLIVSMHWGIEYNLNATEIQKSQAKFLADNGVDIVIGTHSHCLEPFEIIDDTVVFYSLGNFISNQMGAEQANVRKVGTIGAFVTLDITKTIESKEDTKGTIKIDNIGADLNYSYRYYNSDIGMNDYLVIPFSKMEEKYLKDYESLYTEFSDVLKKYDDSINIKPLPVNAN